MAKKNDQLAGGFDTENTGGVLSGLLADEEQLDRRAMFRLGSWGVASVGAVIIAVLANQSTIKSRHDEVAALDLTRQSQQIQSVARESQNETRRLASAIDTLNGDRDRMYTRLTTLEQGLDSVTGAIAKQNVATSPPAAKPPSVPAAAMPSAAASQPIAKTVAPEPAPAVSPVTTTAMATPAPEKPRAEAKKPASPTAAPAAATTPVPAASNPPAAPSAVPLMASKSLMAPPDAAAGKLIEPEPSAKTATAKTVEAKIAEAKAADVKAAEATPPPEPASMTPVPSAPAPQVAASKPAADKVATAEPAPSAAPPLAVKHTEFGVDVGGANSVGGLRALWRGLLKSRSNAPLAALQPIIVVKERDNGLGMQLRLVAGPLGDAAAAAKICARMAGNGRPCETTVFDGQRLALKADDMPVATESISAKPASVKPSEEKLAPEKSSAAGASPEKSAAEKPVATKPGSSRYSRHRGYFSSKRAAVEEPEPKKPETSSGISSFFSSRIHPQ